MKNYLSKSKNYVLSTLVATSLLTSCDKGWFKGDTYIENNYECCDTCPPKNSDNTTSGKGKYTPGKRTKSSDKNATSSSTSTQKSDLEKQIDSLKSALNNQKANCANPFENASFENYGKSAAFDNYVCKPADSLNKKEE